MLDLNYKLLKPGDRITLIHNGHSFAVECIATTVIEFQRKYRIRFEDGSERYMTASEIHQAN